METTTIALNKSSVLGQLSQNLLERDCMSVTPEVCGSIYKVLISSIPSFLFAKKSKDAGKVGLKIEDPKGNTTIGGIVTYHKPDGEDDDKGNWSLEFTFDNDDLADISSIYESSSSEFVQVYERLASEIFHGSFLTPQWATTIFTECVVTLKEVLKANAVEGKIFEIVEDGYFIASSTIEGGEVIYAIVPGDMMKTIVKDDSAL